VKISRGKRERGSAVFIIMILLALLAAYISSNAVALAVLKRDIQLIEKRQANQRPPAAPQPSAATEQGDQHGKNPAH
jgi:hypothetical protein